MLSNGHIELMRMEANFWEFEHGVPATVWFHISIVRFFKRLTQEEINGIEKQFASCAPRYFRGNFIKQYCRLHIDNTYGLRSWSCPGDTTSFGIADDQMEYAKNESTGWIKYVPQNLDNLDQFSYLSTVACRLRDYAEAHLIFT